MGLLGGRGWAETVTAEGKQLMSRWRLRIGLNDSDRTRELLGVVSARESPEAPLTRKSCAELQGLRGGGTDAHRKRLAPSWVQALGGSRKM